MDLFFITWILHHIIMYSNKVKLVAGFINDPSHSTPLTNPHPSYWMNELANKFGPCYQPKLTTPFALHINISKYNLYPYRTSNAMAKHRQMQL